MGKNVGGGGFREKHTFSIYGHLAKNAPQIFERQYGYKIIKQNASVF